MKKVIRILLCCSVGLFLFISAMTIHGTVAHAAGPNGTTCFGGFDSGFISCDGVAPPPISNCNHDQQDGVFSPVTLYDSHNGVAGVLHLFYSSNAHGCSSKWFAVRASENMTVNAIGIWEENGFDGSNEGGLDSMPHSLVAGGWESTYMIGQETNFLGNTCAHGAIGFTDKYNHKFGFINTKPDCSF